MWSERAIGERVDIERDAEMEGRDGWKNETLHRLYIRFTFGDVLNGV